MKPEPSAASKPNRGKHTSRMLCVWLPDFPIQRLHCEQPETKPAPIVLYTESGSRAAVVIASAAARQYGIRQGMPLAEAQALHESALFLPHDADADTTTLLALAGVCYRYSPLVGLERSNDTHCLVLDISGCAHLHGDESGLTRALVVELAERGYFAHVAVAGTIGAAWAIARFGHGAGTNRRLKSLPVEALRIPDRLLPRLSEFDLRTIGQLTALPRESLPSRFGPILTERLDQLFGRREELLTPVPRPEPVFAQWTDEDPICHRGAIQHVCADLLSEILDTLKSRSEGLLGLELSLASDATEPVVLEIRLARPNDSLPHLLKLLELKLETHHIPEWLHTIRMEATETAIQKTRQRDLFTLLEPASDDRHVRDLFDRLSARLGPHAVVRPQLLPEAVPEQAVRYTPLSETPSVATLARAWEPSFHRLATVATARPLTLLPRPEPICITTSSADLVDSFYWSSRSYRIAHCTSIERIVTAWWQETGLIHRDYYQVETHNGARFWLFQTCNNWFLHGLFE